jgi:hypothetical protein
VRQHTYNRARISVLKRGSPDMTKQAAQITRSETN